MTEALQVEVALALSERQELVVLRVAPGTTARQAVELSGLLARLPESAAESLKLGVFGKAVKDDAPLREHDRVEIYRPLIADPKTVRRQRAEAGKQTKKGGGS
ncbi:RnfH family protein [Chromobacterium haemolyticum]|uniref:RnfH family protein n=1 Tax=Chromobacterium haemolyticum TaxID=394935 RepID=UPI0009DA6F01|nr:RnfH family protein [Chromobacterium haemolyticum]OQS41183.1 RnfH family protein [Chromobacterium haemolyticum]